MEPTLPARSSSLTSSPFLFSCSPDSLFPREVRVVPQQNKPKWDPTLSTAWVGLLQRFANVHASVLPLAVERKSSSREQAQWTKMVLGIANNLRFRHGLSNA